jgi:hypothetical protein
MDKLNNKLILIAFISFALIIILPFTGTMISTILGDTLARIIWMTILISFLISYTYFLINILIMQFKHKQYLYFIGTIVFNPLSIFYYFVN